MTDAAQKTTYLFSDWYSGATLLAILLGNHPAVTCNGETLPFVASEAPLYNCTCGVPLLSCQFYKSAAHGVFTPFDKAAVDPDFAILPHFSRIGSVNRLLNGVRFAPALRDLVLKSVPQFRHTYARFTAKHRQFVARCCTLDGSEVYVDGTKSIRRAEMLCDDVGNTTRVIHLVRDGRAFCHSFVKHQRYLGKTLDDGIRRWIAYNDMVDRFRQKCPTLPFLLVRYEDLCRDTHGTLETLCQFIGVRSDVDLAVPPDRPYHVLGNKMRKRFDGSIRENRLWETEMHPDDRARIESALREPLRRFRYLDS